MNPSMEILTQTNNESEVDFIGRFEYLEAPIYLVVYMWI